MAVSTANTTLQYSPTDSSYNTLCNILSYPDMGSSPSKLDTTDLSATTIKTYMFGLMDAPDLTFECNYDETVYNTINTTLAGNTYYFKLLFGATDGSFKWQGQVKVFAKGGGVDEVRKMTIVISATTAITFATT